MRDPSTMPGWWQDSNGQWWPPERHPNYGPSEMMQDEDPTYEDREGIDWWWDGSDWNYWRESDNDWTVLPGAAPAGLLLDMDEPIPLNLQPVPPGYWRASDGRLYPPQPGGGWSLRQARAESTVPAGGWLAIAGGLMIAVGSLLPWMTFGLLGLSRNGFQLGDNESLTADGPTCLVLGIITVIIGITRLTGTSMPRWIERSTIVTGILAGLTVVANWSAIHDFVSTIQSKGTSAAIGYGYWICATGAVVAVVAGFILRSAE
jgi:hypothetical protein